MKIQNGMSMLLLFSSCLTAGNALAASVAGDVVYEKVDMFKGAVHFTDSFMIGTAGTYQATLTDFKFPNAFKESGLNITTGALSLGKLPGPGTLTFEAGTGDYYVSMFAKVGHRQASAEEIQRLTAKELTRRGNEWWQSLTKEEKMAKKAVWQSWTKEEMAAHREKVRRRTERRIEEQLNNASLGQYGVQIAMLDGAIAGALPQGGAPVPLPATAWLMGSGMLGLVGFGRRSVRRSRV